MKTSLYFWDGYGSKAAYEKQLPCVPASSTATLSILSPNFAGPLQADGSFGNVFTDPEIPKYLVALGQRSGAKVVPMVLGSGKSAGDMLRDPLKHSIFKESCLKLIRDTGADGILVDLEALPTDTGPGLTALMKDLYAQLSAKGKLTLVSVMSRTSEIAEPWCVQYNYAELSGYANYVQIMSYDLHYATSAPGPIAPPDWVRRVMAYAVTRIPPSKALMGIPFYGRAWRQDGTRWVSKALGLTAATQTAERYRAITNRETSPSNPIGTPTYCYTDEHGHRWTVYYDDSRSWSGKLSLLNEFNLGGIGCWSLAWLDQTSAGQFAALLE
ncbi:MAG: glycosyl hydrolase [Dehalobacter sp. 4CP]|uniref:glycosyl hydrolase family 18 protein n=1 Tax=unclassified Dehalobacter TaxID=2635733 RepID=UPI0013CC6B24|nr:glycosyl hydrolase family 18 protein [Dehalobacter sp.]MDJ0305574.1 glycosyl hydrolase family 18 protein [Dehalobacter sp.]NBJ15090.1 glycosyl hydrolase [Dehalobacter sp. 4CP]